MRKTVYSTLLSIIFSIALAGLAIAAGGDLDWSYGSGTTGKQDVRAAAFDSAGNTILVGVDGVSSASNWFVAKVKADGSGLAWATKTFDMSGGIDEATAVVIDHLDNIIVSGTAHNGSDFDIHTIKYNSAGVVQWQHTYDATGGDDYAKEVSVDSSNNVYVGGQIYGSNGNDDFVVIRYQASGPVNDEPLWATPINGGANGHDRLSALAVNTTGLAVTGESESATPGDFNFFVHKLNFDGTFAWAGGPQIYSDSGNGMGLDIVVDANGEVIATGYVDDGTRAMYTAKYASADGSQIWSKKRTGDTTEGGQAIAFDSNNDIFVTGTSYSASTSFDVYTVKYQGADPVGGVPVELWSDSYNTANGNHDAGLAMVVDAGDDLFVTAYSNDLDGNGDDSFLTLKYCGDDGAMLWPDNTIFALDSLNNRPVSIGIGSLGNILVGGWTDTATNDYDFLALSYDPGSLDPPTGLGTEVLTNTSVRLSWTDNSEPPNSEDNFVVARRAEGEADFTELTPVLAAGIITFDDTGLTPDTRYYYKVKATSAADGNSAWSNTVDVRTTVISYAAPTWLHLFAGTAAGDDEARSIATGADQHPVVTGSSYAGVLDGGHDYLTIKLDRTDETVEQWSARYNDGDNNGDYGTSVVVDSQDRVVVTGYASLFGGGGGNTNDVYTVGYASDGQPTNNGNTLSVWDDQYNGPDGDDDKSSAVAVATDGSDNTVVIGYGKNASFNNDIYVIKFDPDGNRLWVATPYDGGGEDYPAAVAFDSNGNVFVVGNEHNGTDDDWYVARYAAADGTRTHIAPLHAFAGNGEDYARSVVVDEAGDVYVTGYAFNGTSGDIYTVKYSGTDLSILWQQPVDSGGYDLGADIGIDPVNGNILVAGTSYIGAGNKDFRLIRYTASGNAGAGDEVWNHRVDLSGTDDSVEAMAIDNSGVAILTGTSDDDILTVKIDHNETIVGANVFDGVAGDVDYPADVAVNMYGEAFVAGTTMNGDAVPNNDYVVFMADGGTMQTPYPLVATQLYAEVNLSWADNELNGTGFELERKDSACSSADSWHPLATPGDGVTSYVDGSDGTVSVNTTYCYRIKTTSASDSSRWVELEVTTSDPQAPSDLSVALLNDTDIKINWTDNTTDATGYEFVLERCSGDSCLFGSATQVVVSSAATDSETGIATYVDKTACSGSVYRYQVKARKRNLSDTGDLWVSLFSTPTAAAGIAPIAPAAPSGMNADIVTETLVNLSWDDNTDGEGEFIIERCDGDAVACDPGSWSTLGTLTSTAGNVLLMRMDEASWDGTPGEVTDSSGNSNHGAASNADTTITGRFGRGGAFTNGYAQVNTSLSLDQSAASAGATMAAWVKPSMNDDVYNYLFDTDNGGYDWSLLHNGTNWLVNSGDDGGPVDTGVAVTFDTWQHVAAVYDPVSGVRLFKNGAEIWSDAGIDFDSTTHEFSVGSKDNIAGRVLSYHMDEVSWDQYSASVIDSSGNGNHGTPSYNVATLDEGRYNTAGTFDGVDNHISTTLNIDQSSGTSGATFEGWFKPSDPNYTYRHAISTDNGGYDWALVQRGPQWWVNTGTTRTYATVADVGKWQHVAVVYDPATSTTILYKNGVPTSNLGYNTDASSADVAIGRDPTSVNPNYTGQMDSVNIYTRALTAQEVLDQYQNRSITGVLDEVSVFNHPLASGEIVDLHQHGVARFEDTTIVDDQNYTYRVKADKADSCVSDWPTATSTTVSANTRPRGPDVYATLEDVGRVRLDWITNTSTHTGFEILRCDVSVDGAGCTPVSFPGNTVSASTAQWVDEDGCVNKTYRYQVNVLGFASADPGNIVEVTVPNLLQPAGLSETDISEGHVDLEWAINDPAATGYRIGHCDASGSCSLDSDFNPTADINALPEDNQLYLKMDKAVWINGSADVEDSSGKGNNGTSYNDLAPAAGGKYGWAGDFDGSNDYLATTYNVDQSISSAGATYEAWVYPTKNTNSYQYIISTENGGNDWSLGLYGTTWLVMDGYSTAWSSATVDFDKWQHIMVTFDPQNGVTIYKNGDETIWSNSVIEFDAGDNDVQVGRRANGSYYFEGKIDEVAVYDRVLDAQDALDRYNRTARYSEGVLTPGTTYKVRLWPIKDDTCSSVGPYAELTTTETIDQATLAPTSLAVSDVGTTQADLNWVNNTTSETDIVVERCTGTLAACGSTDGNYADFSASPVSLSSGVDFYSDDTVCAESAYTYRVRSERSVAPLWTTPWTYVERPALTLSTPANFTAWPLTESEIGMSWADTTIDEDRFVIERCPGTTFGCGSPTSVLNSATLPGNLLYYRMDEAAWINGNADVLDLTGHGNHGTSYNGANTSDSGKYGRGGDVSANNDYVKTPIHIDQTVSSTGATFEAWVYPTLSDSQYRFVFSTENGGYDWSLAMRSGIWYVYTGASRYSTGITADLDTWQHVAITFEPGVGVYFYKDGGQVPADIYGPAPIGYDLSSTDLHLGGYGSNPAHTSYNFYGQIDEVAVFDQPLSAAEVLSHYQTRAQVFEFVDTGLSPGTDYTYQLSVAKSPADGCDWRTSTTYNSATFSVPAPDGFVVDSLGTTDIGMIWNDKTGAEDSFQIQRCDDVLVNCQDADPGIEDTNFSALNATPGKDAETYTDSTTCPDSNYSYRIRARKTVEAPMWDTDWVYLEAHSSAIEDLSSFSLNRVSEVRIDLSWDDINVDESNFVIERCEYKEPAAPCTVFSPLDTVSTSDTTINYADDELKPGYTYRYQVKAVKNAPSNPCNSNNGWETSYAGPLTQKASIVPPTLTNVQEQSTSTVELAWVNNAPTSTGTVIERCTNVVAAACDFSTVDIVDTVPKGATTFTDNTVCQDLTYTYRLKSVGDGLSGAESGCWNRKAAVQFTSFVPESVYEIQVNYDNDMRTDFGDLRFYDETGNRQLDYWIYRIDDQGQPTAKANILLRTWHNDNVSLYYGNASAENAGQQDSFVVLYDDFAGTVIDSGKWTEKDTVDYITQNDGLQLEDLVVTTGSWSSALWSVDTFDRDANLELYVEISLQNDSDGSNVMLIGWEQNQDTNTSYTLTAHGMQFQSYMNNTSGTFYIYEASSYITNTGSYSYNTDFDIKVVPYAGGGAIYYVRGGIYPDWTVLSDTGSHGSKRSDTLLRVGVHQSSQQGIIRSIQVRERADSSVSLGAEVPSGTCYSFDSNYLWGSGYSTENLFDTTRSAQPPTLDSATVVDDSSVELTWTNNTDADVVFDVYRSGCSGDGTIATDVAATSYTDTAAPSSSSCDYYVHAKKDTGTCTWDVGPSNVLNADTYVASPSNFVAAAENSRLVKLTWTNDSAFGEDGFEIQVKKGNGPYFTTATLVNGPYPVDYVVGVDGMIYYEGRNIESDRTYTYRIRSYQLNDIDPSIYEWSQYVYSNSVTIPPFNVDDTTCWPPP